MIPQHICRDPARKFLENEGGCELSGPASMPVFGPNGADPSPKPFPAPPQSQPLHHLLGHPLLLVGSLSLTSHPRVRSQIAKVDLHQPLIPPPSERRLHPTAQPRGRGHFPPWQRKAGHAEWSGTWASWLSAKHLSLRTTTCLSAVL